MVFKLYLYCTHKYGIFRNKKKSCYSCFHQNDYCSQKEAPEKKDLQARKDPKDLQGKMDLQVRKAIWVKPVRMDPLVNPVKKDQLDQKVQWVKKGRLEKMVLLGRKVPQAKKVFKRPNLININ